MPYHQSRNPDRRKPNQAYEVPFQGGMDGRNVRLRK